MKNNLITISIIILSTLSVDAQSWKFLTNEFSFGIGATSFLGDLGGANRIGSRNLKGIRDFDFNATRPAVSIGYRKFFSPNLSAKAGFTLGQVSGDDALTEERFRENRNLHFRSPIAELAVQVEYFPFREYFGHIYRSNGVVGKRVNHLSPYLFAGIGGFFYNPKAKYQGNWEKLRPLKTENVDYNSISLAIPVGLGLKYAIDKQWSIGLEVGLRYTTTDYIDDVSTEYVDKSGSDAKTQYLSNPALNNEGQTNWTLPGQQRGSTQSNDSYVFAILSVNYKLLRGRLNLPKF
jgi:hypothetical protein